MYRQRRILVHLSVLISGVIATIFQLFVPDIIEVGSAFWTYVDPCLWVYSILSHISILGKISWLKNRLGFTGQYCFFITYQTLSKVHFSTFRVDVPRIAAVGQSVFDQGSPFQQVSFACVEVPAIPYGVNCLPSFAILSPPEDVTSSSSAPGLGLGLPWPPPSSARLSKIRWLVK